MTASPPIVHEHFSVRPLRVAVELVLHKGVFSPSIQAVLLFLGRLRPGDHQTAPSPDLHVFILQEKLSLDVPSTGQANKEPQTVTVCEVNVEGPPERPDEGVGAVFDEAGAGVVHGIVP